MKKNYHTKREKQTLKDNSQTAIQATLSLQSVAEASCLKNYFARGLGAIKEKSCINVPHTRRASGSVNLDKAMEKDYPEDNRWDYALEYDGYTFFLEVHPASTSEIKCMIKKVEQVKTWLAENVPDLLKLPKKEKGARVFYWISSGKSDIRLLPQSQQARSLAKAHIKRVGRIWNYLTDVD